MSNTDTDTLLSEIKKKVLLILSTDLHTKIDDFDSMFDIFFPNYEEKTESFKNDSYISVHLVNHHSQIDGKPICKIRLHEKFKQLAPKEQVLSLYHAVVHGWQMYESNITYQ